MKKIGSAKHPVRFMIWSLWAFFYALSVPGQQLPFRNYSLRDGLLSATAYIFFQDHTGYLWIATDGGLSRFDGQHFTNFEKTADGTELGIILSMAQTADGQIWAGGNGNGLFEFDGSQFIHHSIGPESGSNLVTALYETESNVLLIGTERGVFSQKKGIIRPLLPEVKMMRSFKFSASGDMIKTADNRIRALLDGEIVYLNPQTGLRSEPLPHPKSDDQFNWITPLTDGRLVVGCVNQHRVYLFRGDRLEHTLVLPDCSPAYAIDDGRGGLWIATDKGFLKTNLASPSVTNAEWITTQNGLPFTKASTAFLDRERNLWLGSYGKGIYKLEEADTYRFGYPFAAGLGCTDAKGRLLFSTPDGLRVISRTASGAFRELTLEPFPDRYYKSMGTVSILPGNQLWLGCDDGHLANFQIDERGNGHLKVHFRREIGPRTGFPPIKPIWLFTDRKGRVWFSAKDRPYLYVMDITKAKPRLVKKLSFDPGKRLSNGRNMIEDTSGNFWFVYETNKVVVFDANLNHKQTFTNLAGKVGISCVHQDVDGSIWFGTDSDGLIRRSATGRIQRLSRADGLLSDRIIRMAEGPNRTLWVATWQGLAFVNYKGDSLQLSENREVTESPIWSLGVYPDGMGWVATNFEVVYHKRQVAIQPVIPPILLRKLLVNGEEHPIRSENLRLQAAENNLVFEFGSVYFQSRDRLRFRWKLEGSWNEWSPPSSLESVNFAGLKPGRYIFWVKAITSEGVESAKPVRFSFEIVPPIWQRWWFFVACLLVVVGLTWFVIQIRVRRLLEIERLRARIAADLHDDIGSGLTRIALASEMLLRQQTETTALRQSPIFQRIGSISRELTEAMSDIVWAIDPANDTLAKVLERIQIFASDICDAKGIVYEPSFAISEQEKHRKLGPDIVNSILLITKEALTNIARHAHCRHLFLSVSASSQQLCIQLMDDGVGFDEKALSRRNGLTNMRQRAKKVGADLIIISSLKLGTKIELRFTFL